MSIWQWQAAISGYMAAHAPKKDGGLTDSERDALFDWTVRDQPKAVSTLTTMTYRLTDDGRLEPAGVVTFTLD